MKRALLPLLVFLVVSAAFAQEAKRVVILPFNAVASAEPYRVGMATGIQRSLNVVDGMFVPPVGDAFLVVQRLNERGELSAGAVAQAFGASVVVSGVITPVGNEAEVMLGFAGPDYPQARDVTVRGPLGDSRRLIRDVTDAVIAELGIPVSAQDRAQLAAMINQVPTLPSLRAVGEASLRLPGRVVDELQAASEIDGRSSWVLSEYARALALDGQGDRALEVSQRGMDAEPNDIEALVIRGNILVAAGDTATARQAFDAALALNPAHAVALLGRGNLVDGNEAQAALEAAVAAYPRLVDGYLDLAERQATTSGARAMQTLRRGADAVPDSIALRRAVLRQAIAIGDNAGALSYLRAEIAKPEVRSAALYALALELPLPEYTEQALAIVREGRDRYAESASLALAHANLLQGAGRGDEALTVLAEAVERNPNNLELLNQYAIRQATAGNLDGARATLERAAGRDTTDTLAVNLAQIYLQAGQSRAAVETLEPLLERRGSDAEVFALYGVALGRSGRIDQARNALEQALALEPGNALAATALRSLQQEQNLTRGEPIEELRGEAAVLFEAGRNALDAGDAARAATEFARALELQDSALIAFYHGFALQRSGQPRPAIASYERALQDFAGSDVVLNNLGYAHLQVGRFDRALELLTRASTANPGNAEAQLNLGLAYYALGRYPSAVESLERAIGLNPAVNAEVEELLAAAKERAGQ